MVLDRLMLKPWEPSNWLGKYRIDASGELATDN
jgi:hypothetical protein